MFKKRLAKRGVRKNYTKAQKRDALAHLNRNMTSVVPTFNVNDRPLKVARLHWAVQHHGQLIRLEPSTTSAIVSEQAVKNRLPDYDLPYCLLTCINRALARTTDILQRQGCEARSSTKLVHEILHMPDAEVYLLWIKQYYDWYCSNTNLEPGYRYCSSLVYVFENLRNGRHHLHNPTRSFRLFDQACSDVESLVHEQPFQLLNQLMVEFFQSTWNDFKEMRSAILNFISYMACRLHGSNHPLAKAISLLRSDEVLAQATPTAIGLASAIVDKHLGLDETDTWEIKIATVTSLLEIVDTSAAENQWVTMIRQARCECPSWAERHALEKLAWTRWRQGRSEEAELLCLEVLWRHVEAKSTPIPKGSGMDACQILGEISVRRKDYEGAEIWHRLCLYGALGKPDSPALRRHVQKLCQTLRIQGKTAEIESVKNVLRENLGVWEVIIEEGDGGLKYSCLARARHWLPSDCAECRKKVYDRK